MGRERKGMVCGRDQQLIWEGRGGKEKKRKRERER